MLLNIPRKSDFRPKNRVNDSIPVGFLKQRHSGYDRVLTCPNESNSLVFQNGSQLRRLSDTSPATETHEQHRLAERVAKSNFQKMTSSTLDADEIFRLTGYKYPSKQLSVLHKRGFTRAYITREGVVLERPHFESVCTGNDKAVGHGKEANLGFFGGK